MPPLAERLRKVRKEQGLTQEQLASLVGLNRVTIVGYERGSRQPDLGILVRLADALQVTTDHLLGRAGEPRGAGLADTRAVYESKPVAVREEILRELSENVRGIESEEDLAALARLARGLLGKRREP